MNAHSSWKMFFRQKRRKNPPNLFHHTRHVCFLCAFFTITLSLLPNHLKANFFSAEEKTSHDRGINFGHGKWKCLTGARERQCKVGGTRGILNSFLSMRCHRVIIQFCPSWRGGYPLCPRRSRVPDVWCNLGIWSWCNTEVRAMLMGSETCHIYMYGRSGTPPFFTFWPLFDFLPFLWLFGPSGKPLVAHLSWFDVVSTLTSIS